MNRFYRALEAKYQADVEEALAVVDLYFNKSVGVGEHPTVIEELDKYMGQLESSMGKLETLKKIFNATDDNEQAPDVSNK
jgi:hypothetical protein|tara:strand:- start:1904 stop:2143 length:240 start_codon:yes stop_codon:yes gene_type:complete